MIRILLVDDHTIVREALRALLEQEPDMQIVAEAADGENALRLIAELGPELVIMDVSLPGEDGIKTTRRLLARNPAIKVIALSMYSHSNMIHQMFDAGAAGYVVKSAAGTELRRGIRTVVQGRRYLCPESAESLANGLPNRGRTSADSERRALSRRELQVAILFAQGKTAPAIAADLHLAPSTIEVHRRNIMRKLDLHKAADLTRYVIRAGLISP
jgi:two-component system NarL family response regulator